MNYKKVVSADTCEKCTQSTFGRRSDGVGRHSGVVWSCLEVEWGRWESVGDRWIGGGVGKAFWSRLGVLRGRWEGVGRGGVEILGRKLGDIGQTFVNLYDLLGRVLRRRPGKRNWGAPTERQRSATEYQRSANGAPTNQAPHKQAVPQTSTPKKNRKQITKQYET